MQIRDEPLHRVSVAALLERALSSSTASLNGSVSRTSDTPIYDLMVLQADYVYNPWINPFRHWGEILGTNPPWSKHL